MNLQVDVTSATAEPVPDEDDIRSWIIAALEYQKNALPDADCEISIRLVDSAEMSRLNQQYRGKDGPTNVLSFPCDLPAELAHPLLGDVVICAPVVRCEANEQGKSNSAHWAHMAVHGTLHLLGYDHVQNDEADIMEALETRILSSLDFPCPYHTASRSRSAC